ncbi:MAG: hydrogenase expression/formation protein HypE [Verrucomicrobia bacterium]|nr:hydrogenase expression/formation protein HypE [Verrucomicrobiota bacterium]
MTLSCPTIIEEDQVITLAHGSGGKKTSELIEKIFVPAFCNDLHHDGALLNISAQQIVMTTDSYVVQPLFFPGGDIGKLAVTGTLNDLAMCGAKPSYLSCSFIIEEGFLIKDLKRIVASMQREAAENGVQIVTGDTKVIERQTGSNIFINTTGIGISRVKQPIHPHQIQKGDVILLSGDVGRHGMAIMAMRENLEFTRPLLSDCCPLFPQVEPLFPLEVHCLRDLTRGGLATALVELAESSTMEFRVSEEAIPVSQPVASACEILGLDPLYVANEGRFIAILPAQNGQKALELIDGSTLIGEVVEAKGAPRAILKNGFGTHRFLYRMVGEQLPRIC